jgi:predicted amidophosphoribosyltransferase
MGPSFEQAKVLVIPVPLYKGKRHQRGFNQAELIVRAAVKVHSRGVCARSAQSRRRPGLGRDRGTHHEDGLEVRRDRSRSG